MPTNLLPYAQSLEPAGAGRVSVTLWRIVNEADAPGGSGSSFGDWFVGAWPRAFKLATFLTHDTQSGEDIAQDVVTERQMWLRIAHMLDKNPSMSVRLRRPSPSQLRSLVEHGSTDSLTYDPVGISALAEPPHGYRLDRWSRTLGQGDEIFNRARGALRQWRVHEGAGLMVEADGPPVEGAVVAMAAPLPIGFIEVVCRVVKVVDEPDRAGFVYGTLANHPEQGEESFMAIRSDDGVVTFEIVAVSRPRQILARAFPPVARHLQLAATNRYFDAMQSAMHS
jgi:uncharacterized protein (UPF0548 family)